LTGQAAAVQLASEAHSKSGFYAVLAVEIGINRKRKARKIGMNCFIKYLKCFASFYGMVNLLAEEKNGRCSLGRKSLLSANTNA
jgi:hypothetical protein